ncbi:MAG TPA: hypothetical protein VNR64_11960, partial [Vicinamibacterales bacterium]|nr:hypothetical protein [Vicinamibacterales bacterium]
AVNNPVEAEMRKQDRILREQNQNPSKEHPEDPRRRPEEDVKGSASKDQPNRPPRQPGRLPLPD